MWSTHGEGEEAGDKEGPRKRGGRGREGMIGEGAADPLPGPLNPLTLASST